LENGGGIQTQDREMVAVFQRHDGRGKPMTSSKQGYVYILASKPNGTLYTGVTSNLIQRVYQHKHHLVEGFTQKYDVTLLVWYEVHDEITAAIYREKQIKEWKRSWKLALIEKENPDWCDLYPEIAGLDPAPVFQRGMLSHEDDEGRSGDDKKSVIPAKAGIQSSQRTLGLDPDFRRDDKEGLDAVFQRHDEKRDGNDEGKELVHV
jgi:putative endonuclease